MFWKHTTYYNFFFTVIRNLANLNYLFLYLNYLQNLLWY